MPHISPLPFNTTPELADHFNFFLSTLGFVPNSVLTMQRKPKLVKAFAALNAAVMDPEGEVDLGFRRLIGFVASQAAGCRYCMAHTLLGAKNFGITDERLAAVWIYQKNPLFTDAERAALDYALAAAAQPGAVDDALMTRMKSHWSESQIVEILGVIAMFGFLNRWNDAMATPLEAVPLGVAVNANAGFSGGKHS